MCTFQNVKTRRRRHPAVATTVWQPRVCGSRRGPRAAHAFMQALAASTSLSVVIPNFS